METWEVEHNTWESKRTEGKKIEKRRVVKNNNLIAKWTEAARVGKKTYSGHKKLDVEWRIKSERCINKGDEANFRRARYEENWKRRRS